MLTEQEREWLERRKKNENEYGSVYCPHCDQFNPEWDLYLGYCDNSIDCPITEHDFHDAAKFEARVAKRLSAFVHDAPPPDLWPQCRTCAAIKNDDTDACLACVLKESRLAVEQEMEELNDA